MSKTSTYNIRPLTTKMKKLLMECHERELRKEAPSGIYYTQSAKGLVTRGLFYAKEYNNGSKPYMGFYLTELGIEYLNEIK